MTAADVTAGRMTSRRGRRGRAPPRGQAGRSAWAELPAARPEAEREGWANSGWRAVSGGSGSGGGAGAVAAGAEGREAPARERHGVAGGAAAAVSVWGEEGAPGLGPGKESGPAAPGAERGGLGRALRWGWSRAPELGWAGPGRVGPGRWLRGGGRREPGRLPQRGETARSGGEEEELPPAERGRRRREAVLINSAPP